MKKVLVVSNYNAGRKKAIKYKKKVQKFLLKNCESFKFVSIDEFQDYIDEYDVVFAAGGDGTVNKLLPYLVNSDKILGILPSGTANLLAAKIGLSSALDKTLKIIEKQNVVLSDVLKVNENFCVLRCGFGYDSDIICKTPQSLKNKFGYFAYFIAGIIFGLRLKKRQYKLTLDGKTTEKEASCVIFANSANMFKNIFSVASSKINDGRFDIFILKTENPIVFFIEFLRIIFNLRTNSLRAEYSSAKNICMQNEWSVCHIDGEKKNIKGQIDISVIPSAVKIFASFKEK